MVKMDDVGFHLPDNSRVRLRNIVDPKVYGDFACVGNEGWIRDQRRDKFGLPEILIEWDKDHWAYNGVPDTWTFAEHFELAENRMDNKQEAARQAALEFAERMSSIFDKEAKPESKPQTRAMDLTRRLTDAGRVFQAEVEDKPDDWTETVDAASTLVSDADAFIIIGVDGNSQPFAFGNARNPKSELAVEAHLAGVAARAHQDLVLHELQRVAEGQE